MYDAAPGSACSTSRTSTRSRAFRRRLSMNAAVDTSSTRRSAERRGPRRAPITGAARSQRGGGGESASGLVMTRPEVRKGTSHGVECADTPGCRRRAAIVARVAHHDADVVAAALDALGIFAVEGLATWRPRSWSVNAERLGGRLHAEPHLLLAGTGSSRSPRRRRSYSRSRRLTSSAAARRRPRSLRRERRGLLKDWVGRRAEPQATNGGPGRGRRAARRRRSRPRCTAQREVHRHGLRDGPVPRRATGVPAPRCA